MTSIHQTPAASKRPLPIETIGAHQAAEREKDRALADLAEELRTSRELADALLERNADLEAELIAFRANAESAAILARETIREQQKALRAAEEKAAIAQRQVERRDEQIDALMSEAICSECNETFERCIELVTCDRCPTCERLPKHCGCANRCGQCRRLDCGDSLCRARDVAAYRADEGRGE